MSMGLGVREGSKGRGPGENEQSSGQRESVLSGYRVSVVAASPLAGPGESTVSGGTHTHSMGGAGFKLGTQTGWRGSRLAASSRPRQEKPKPFSSTYLLLLQAGPASGRASGGSGTARGPGGIRGPAVLAPPRPPYMNPFSWLSGRELRQARQPS